MDTPEGVTFWGWVLLFFFFKFFPAASAVKNLSNSWKKNKMEIFAWFCLSLPPGNNSSIYNNMQYLQRIRPNNQGLTWLLAKFLLSLIYHRYHYWSLIITFRNFVCHAEVQGWLKVLKMSKLQYQQVGYKSFSLVQWSSGRSCLSWILCCEFVVLLKKFSCLITFYKGQGLRV